MKNGSSQWTTAELVASDREKLINVRYSRKKACLKIDIFTIHTKDDLTSCINDCIDLLNIEY